MVYNFSKSISSKNLNKLIRNNLELLQKIIGYIYIISLILNKALLWNFKFKI